MSDVTLIGFPGSTYLRSARLVCEEKGIAYTVDPFSAFEFRSAEHDALHPFAKMPVLRHGDFVLFETAAIGRYLDANFPGPSLIPGDAREAARVEQWISALVDYCYRPLVHLWNDDSRRALDALERALDPGPHLLGKTLTLADLMLAPMLDYLDGREDAPGALQPYARIRSFLTRMRQRPGFQATA